jgi:hypothetical protein
VPVLTVTVRVAPGPADTVVIEGAVPKLPVVVSPKLLAVPPVTDSLKVTVKVTEAAFVGLVPPRAIELTVGAVVSMTMVLFAPRDPAAPGLGRVRVALVVPFLMVPPLSANAVADNSSRSAEVWPAPTV